ncbi:MAG: hypothetical protein GTO14_17070 [Anaerolineales bacterium]|nr:hypothetical protein [Anaerolineales bacterium]
MSPGCTSRTAPTRRGKPTGTRTPNRSTINQRLRECAHNAEFTLERVNAFLLDKHHLAPHTKIDDIIQITEDIAGLHATGSTTPYFSLFARTTDFKKRHLDDALYEQPVLGKIRCVRKTIYIHTQAMLPVMYRATAALVENASRRYMHAQGISQEMFDRLSRSIQELLADQDMSASEIKAALEIEHPVSAILYYMCDLGLLLRRKPVRSWKDRSLRYGLFRKYFADVELDALGEQEALTRLIEKYLSAFGPVSENDLQWWTGLGKTTIREALSTLRSQITQIEIEGLEGNYLVCQSEEGRLRETVQGGRRIVTLLPSLDSYLMGYKERRRYLDPQYTNWLFDRSGNATSTILLDGKAVGVWDFEEGNPLMLKIFLFIKVPGDTRKELFAKAAQLGEFIAEREVQLWECTSMLPLPERPAGGFLTPLKGC